MKTQHPIGTKHCYTHCISFDPHAKLPWRFGAFFSLFLQMIKLDQVLVNLKKL